MDRLQAAVSHAGPLLRLVKCPVGPAGATSSDGRDVTGGQGVTGSRRSAPEPGIEEVRPCLPNTCRKPLLSRRLTRSAAVRATVYKTAALPTELHRRETRCMVAHPRLDVLILDLTCTVAVRVAASRRVV